MMLLSLLFLRTEDCTYSFENIVGMRTYHMDMVEGNNVCMDILYYPTIVIFQDFDEDMVFTKYISLTGEEDEYEAKSTYVRYLKNYQAFREPYNKIEFTANSNVTLRFTVLSVPDICNDGLFISTKKQDTFRLSTSQVDNQALHPYDDKCFIPATTGHVDIWVDMTSDYPDTMLYVHENFTNFTVYEANMSKKFSLIGPHFFRVIVSPDTQNTSVHFGFNAKEHTSYNPRTDYFYREQFADVCPEKKTWASEVLAATFAVLDAILIVIDLFWFAYKCYTGASAQKTEQAPQPQQNSAANDFILSQMTFKNLL